ncbi:DUF6508 domain-containing protein [Frigoribacterium sp. PvP032]|uniref:DUF6508 domain-containing protein n=1 Tax=Frigoribacterium sp. PvP032 TaxID=2806589 RepID=UPI001AEB5B8E|nr:DUF6508 domain-containing protein [Frigoribacterium sp. PvP032]MBP1189551.1 hypothetical protein [Frigoribacterium sp. PvP032]
MDERETDAQILEALAAVTAEQRRDLERTRDELAPRGASFGEWKGGQRMASGAIQMPYTSLGPELSRAVDALAEAGLLVPFAWTTWEKGRRYLQDPTTWPEMTPVDGVKTLVTAVRANRFSEGVLLEAADDGVLHRALEAVIEGCSGRSGPGPT